jgi:long-chain acyl-CoA synthetase
MRTRANLALDWQDVRTRIEATPLPLSVPALVDRAAMLFGDRTAWSFFETGEKLTFREVRALSFRAARAFRNCGIDRGDNVAVMAENGPAVLGSWLGLARIGAAIVPVNTRYTARELSHALKLSRARLLVIDRHLLPLIGAVEEDLKVLRNGQILVVGDGTDENDWNRALAATVPTPLTEIEVGPEDILNIQFTSGTTGFPKGCVLSHRYWTQAAVTWGEYLKTPVRNVILNQRLFYIDGQLLAIICLYLGATYHICSKPSVAKFDGWLRDHHIDYCWYAEPLFKAAIAAADPPGTLKLIHIFGFSPKHHVALERRYGAIVREAFGMSEFATSLMMPLEAVEMVGSGSCGLEAPFTEAKIVDETGRVVKRGESGELYLRSDGIMKGYFDDPVATAESFDNSWFKTGDLFRQDGDGFFYIIGRKKDSVRRNSENIACREVEEIIRRIPDVLEVAIVPVRDDVVGEEPKAYVQLRLGSSAEDVPPVLILEFCRQHLAPFKIPRYIQYVSAFPLTESARVAKQVLVAGIVDLRTNSYDAAERIWR